MGILGTYNDSVTLVNRTPYALNVRYDGEDISLKPGENPGFPKVVVEFAKRQNPLKGSQHPTDPRRFICMVGVKGTKDDCSPIAQDVLDAAAQKLERVDRDGSTWDEPMAPVKLLKKRGYSPYEAQASVGGFDNNPSID